MSWGLADRRLLAFCFLLLSVGPGCRRQQSQRAHAIGFAYIAPETLNLRKDVTLSSGTVATVNRGERVEILQRRRRFVKVRTAANQEGWTEQAQLLTPEVHAQIEALARRSASLPSLGVYRARDKLNMHLEPYRWSPSFYQLKEEEKVDLLGRQVAERTTGPTADSRPARSENPPPRTPPKPLPTDEWYLVRTTGEPRRAGWALARVMDAGIPDEVAQYAEGRRITSYYALDAVVNGDEVKKTWLWTTIERGTYPYDFDGFRIFNWSRRKHRYETAYRERNLEGYFPVSVSPKVETRYGTGPGFSIIIEKKGQRLLRRYVMIAPIVRRYAEEPAPANLLPAPTAQPAPAQPPPEQPGLLRRLWNRLRRR